MIDGGILVNKPKDWTSHDVVAKLRNHFRLEKVGHCGTLDPMATGLLLIVIGKATKLSNVLMGSDKRYKGEFTLGIETNSYDAEGETVKEELVPPFSDEEIHSVFKTFVGDQYQVPPMVSAVKLNGQPLYKMARKGEVVEREPRFIHVYHFSATKIELPKIEFDFTATKGTYVRSVAHDLGVKLGCGAHLSRLERAEIGRFKIDQALALEDFLQLTTEGFKNRVIPLHELTMK